MRTMRGVALRTQYALVVGALVVFAGGASVSHWARSRSQADLAISLHRELAILAKLPRLKGQLRRLDLASSGFLRSGEPRWLAERGRLLDEIGRTRRDLDLLLADPRERALLAGLDRELAAHLAAEERLIARKRAGALPAEEADRLLAGRRGYADTLELVLGMHDIGLDDLPELLEDSRRYSRRALAVVLLAGLLASAGLAWVLSRFFIEPISSLAEYAAAWKPGQPWRCAAPSVSPEIDGLFAKVRDLVEGLNAEYRKQLDMNRLKSQFVSMASHELNNALSVIHAAAYSLEELDPDPGHERRRRMHRIIQRQLRSVSLCVSNLLNAGRLESGHLALRRKRMDLIPLLRSCLELQEVLWEEKDLRVSLSVPEGAVEALADPDALTMVVTNLVSNAIKYTPPGGCVTVGISREGRDGGAVRVYVKDTGIGVKPEDRERIFAGHYRTESGRLAAKGFGVGLSLARAIVEAHGGRLELESRPGRGSVFSFLLPAWTEGLGDGEGEPLPDRAGRRPAEAARA